MGPGHYENFPVASLLCPPRWRPPILAFYRFARTADDIADEGAAPPEQRLQELAAFRSNLEAALSGRPPVDGPWTTLFDELARQHRRFAFPAHLLHALLDAFEQDVHNPLYADRGELLAYCARSANPVGRLLLHLFGVADARSLVQSDAVCSALQLINFWQDLSVDVPRGRHYVPASDLAAHGLQRVDLERGQDDPAVRRLVASLCRWARELMLEGAPLATRLPGRVGWELRLVVQGGLRVLERIALMEHATLARRPRLGAVDGPAIVWRALVMR